MSKLPYGCHICEAKGIWMQFHTQAEAQTHYDALHKPKPYTGTHAKMLPIPILFYALLRLRKRVIKEYIHEKLHPFI